MKRLLVLFSLALVALLLTVQGTFAQADSGFSGKAVRWNGDPIVGATISVLAGPLETDQEYARTTTAADGSWSVSLPAGGPYWVHIHTLGTWWGYSYQTPFTLSAGEKISQLYLALGPRDVNEVALPTPISNVSPETGVATPVSNVSPELGYGEEGNPPIGMPHTGSQDDAAFAGWWTLLVAAVLSIVTGLGIRRMATRN